jgi:hypothetical protein
MPENARADRPDALFPDWIPRWKSAAIHRVGQAIVRRAILTTLLGRGENQHK